MKNVGEMGENSGVGMAETTPNHSDGIGGADDMTTPTAKRTTSPAFQFYASDFLSDDKVARMSFTEVGIYILLLSHAWLGCGLPTNPADVAKMLKMPLPRFRKIWAGVLGECFIREGEKLVNPRQERERQKQLDYRRRQSDNGAKGGRPGKGLGSSGFQSEKGLGLSGLTHSKARALKTKTEDLGSALSEEKRSAIRRQWGASAVRDLPPAPYDEWFPQFRDAYHAQGRADNPIVRDAFLGVFTRSDAPPAEIFASLIEAVNNHMAGALWARGMVPAMLKWLDEGYYHQRHDPPAPEAQKSTSRLPAWAQ